MGTVNDSNTRPRSHLGSKERLPNGRWRVRVSCGYTRDGRQRRKSVTVDTEREADVALAALAVEMGRMPNVGDGMTLDEYFWALFVPAREARLANASVRRYVGDYERIVAPLFGSRDMSAIRHAEIQRAVLSMPYGRASHLVTTLRAVLRSAWDDGLLDEEPMRHRLHMPRDDRAQLGVWSAEEVARAMDAMRGVPVEALWLFMVGAGLRREEAYALFWRDVTFEDGTAYAAIDDAVTVEDGRKAVKTAFSERVAVACEPFASRLAELSGEPDAPICAVALTSVPRCWRKLWEEPPRRPCASSYRGRMLEAGVPYLPMSRMRATHETLMQAAGVGDALNNRLHGRASTSEVGYRNYLNPQTAAFRAAAEAMGRLVGGAS